VNNEGLVKVFRIPLLDCLGTTNVVERGGLVRRRAFRGAAFGAEGFFEIERGSKFERAFACITGGGAARQQQRSRQQRCGGEVKVKQVASSKKEVKQWSSK